MFVNSILYWEIYMRHSLSIVIMTLAMWLLCAKANACMPFSPEDVFIARYQGAQAMQVKPASFEVQLSSDQFVFRSLYDWFRYDNATQWYSLFSTQHIAKNSLIIGLAYAPDEKKPKQYQVVSFAKLGCKNNHLEISLPIVLFTAWNRKMKTCAHIDPHPIKMLDGFFDHDHAYYVAKLEQKYPTCQQLNAAFPSIISTEKDNNSKSDNWLNMMWRKYGF